MISILKDIKSHLRSSSLSFRSERLLAEIRIGLGRNLSSKQPRLSPFPKGESEGFPTSGMTTIGTEFAMNIAAENFIPVIIHRSRRSITHYFICVMFLILVLPGLSYAQPKIPKGTIPAHAPPQVRNLIESLYSQSPEERSIAAMKLGDLGAAATPAIPFLIQLFDDTDPILSRAEGKMTQSTSPDREAVTALVKIGNSAVEPLIAVLQDNDVSMKKNAIEALGKIKDRRAVEPLIAALKSEDTSLRNSTVEALGELRDPRALEPLCTLLRDRKLKVKQSTQEALQKIIDKMRDDHAVELLLGATKNKECMVRQMAIKALQETKDTRIVEPLIESLKDEDRGVRQNAAEALGKMKDVRAVGPLIDALHDDDAGVRDRAAKSLTEIGAPSVQPLISSSLKDNQAAVRAKTASVSEK